MLDPEVVDKIFEIFEERNPFPKTELNFQNDFTLLVAVILSARSTDKSVNKATKGLFKKHNTAERMLELGYLGLRKHINTIGLYNNKAKNILATCELLITKYDSKVPNEYNELIKLPGVGRKTANVVLNSLYNKPTIGVDTHLYRVSRRIGLAKSESREKLEKELIKNINPKWIKNLHHWLVLHGRYICKARVPLCEICPINIYCKYYKNNFLALI